MTRETLDPAEPNTWLARGRTPEHAAAIAGAWRDFPDLPPDAPMSDRMARSRARVAVMRPVNDAISAHTEAQREATNFAFLEDQARHGKANDRDLAILRGRDAHGYGWDVANRYADGWYAAHVGWPHSYPDGIPSNAPRALRRAAYDQGFTEGGGDTTDLFDAARRSNLAHLRQSNMPPATISAPTTGRLLPSSWPKPSDDPRPTRWSRRFAIISAADVVRGDTERHAWCFLRLMLARPGAAEATIVVLSAAGFVDGHDVVPVSVEPATGHLSPRVVAKQLQSRIAGREFDDVLVALQDEELGLLDGISDVLPLCRSMERTRNTKLQQRAHLRTWLDRGYGSDDNVAAGHIRWGKAINGLSGKLAEFTARHVGPAPGRGHLVRVEVAGGALASGYAAADGAPLAPELVVSSKARIRTEMAAALRSFAAATPLMGAVTRHAA